MPAARQYAVDSLSSRIRLWLLDHDGPHRPRDIAAGLGIPPDKTRSKWTKEVGAECSRMTDRNLLERVPGTTLTRGGVPASTYRLPEKPT